MKRPAAREHIGRDIEKREMWPEMDTPGNRPTMSWAIVAQARTGSSMLSDMLHRRGAGLAAEYLNPAVQDAYCVRFGIARQDFRLERYLDDMRRLRTAPTGMFAIKCLQVQLIDSFKRNASMREFLGQFDRFILLSRRNRLAQAVSAMKAHQTSRWNSRDRGKARAVVTFDSFFISDRIRRFQVQDHRVSTALDGIDRPALRLDYEDMIADLSGTWRRVQAFLDLDPVPVEEAKTDLRRQADEDNEILARQYLDFLRGG